MRELNLYTTLGCHLCEVAAVMVEGLQVENIILQEVEISESDELLENYGLRIPVLKFKDAEKEIAWPFTEQELAAFLIAD